MPSDPVEGPWVVVPGPARAPARPASSVPGPSLQSGRRVVFLLFLSLWIATLVALLWFARIAEARFPDMTDRVYYALAGNLLAPIVAWFIFKRMKRNRAVVA